MLNFQEIFVPGGFPRHTYNPRLDHQLEERLAEATQNLCKLVTVTGQTKSGKTVLARKILPPEAAIWVDGGAVAQEDDFWQILIERLGLFQSKATEQKKLSARKIIGKGTAQASFFFAKGTGEVGAELEKSRSTGTTSGQILSSRVAALKGLAAFRRPLVIDDFHYVPRTLQASIVRALKPLIFDGLAVVLIAIPHRRYDALKVEKEMTGRIFPIQIPVWSESELIFIPSTGFKLLGIEVPEDRVYRFAREAIGSPHLMQDFCRNMSRRLQSNEAMTASSVPVEKIFVDVAESIGRPIFEKLARGPRQRSDRLQRQLKNGRTVDIYQLVLHALAHLKPSLVSFEYEELRAAIREVSGSQIPQLHEVARVLKHMAQIAATDQSSTPVIDFEEDEKKLHITDPFFAFYLRWGELAQD
jgi:hypothetical protein